MPTILCILTILFCHHSTGCNLSTTTRLLIPEAVCALSGYLDTVFMRAFGYGGLGGYISIISGIVNDRRRPIFL